MDLSVPRRSIHRTGTAPAWLSLTALTICLGACSGKPDASSAGAEEFARFWSDCSFYCKKQETCGVVSEAACLASCQPFDMTNQALASASLSPDDLRNCQSAIELADTCQKALSCSEFTGSTSLCAAELMAAYANCSRIISIVDLHARSHPANPFFGAFGGKFIGADSGSLRCWIYPWSTAWGELTNEAGHVVNVAGAVTGISLTMSGRGKANDGTETITLEGMLSEASGADASPGEFVAKGSWMSSNGGSGTFEMQ